jgi:thioredoxin 1
MVDIHPVNLIEETFDEFVKGADRPVLVDFWAEWCGPCKLMEPILDDIAATENERLIVAKVDVDSYPDLAARFGIMAIPTMILFSSGEEVERIRGAMPRPALLDKLSRHLDRPTASGELSSSGPTASGELSSSGPTASGELSSSGPTASGDPSSSGG